MAAPGADHDAAPGQRADDLPGHRARGRGRGGRAEPAADLQLADQEVREVVPGARETLALRMLAGAGGPDAQVILPPHGSAILA